MGNALHLSKTQLLILVLFIVSLIAIGLIVINGIVPNLWHTLFSYSPDIVNRWH